MSEIADHHVLAMTDDRRMALPLLRGLGLAQTTTQRAWPKPWWPKASLTHLDTGRWAQSKGDEGMGVLLVLEGSLGPVLSRAGRSQRARRAWRDQERRYRQRHALRRRTAIGDGGLRRAEPAAAGVSDAGPGTHRAHPAGRLAGGHGPALSASFVPPSRSGRRRPPCRQGRGSPRACCCSRAGRPSPVYLSLSQQALSEMVGLTRKTVNLHLGALPKDGIIRLEYGPRLAGRPEEAEARGQQLTYCALRTPSQDRAGAAGGPSWSWRCAARPMLLATASGGRSWRARRSASSSRPWSPSTGPGSGGPRWARPAWRRLGAAGSRPEPSRREAA